MADTTNAIKDLGNQFYNGILIALGTTTSRYITTKMLGLKDRPIDLKAKNVGMLALDVGVGIAIKEKVQEMGVPKKIFN